MTAAHLRRIGAPVSAPSFDAGAAAERAELLQLYGVDDAVVAQVALFGQRATGEVAGLAQRLSAHIQSHPLLGGYFHTAEQRARLVGAWEGYLRSLLSGQMDLAHYALAERVGDAHVRVGLAPQHYIGACATLCAELLGLASAAFPEDQRLAGSVGAALSRCMLFDMGVVMQRYSVASSAASEALVAKLGRSIGAGSRDLQRGTSNLSGAIDVQSEASHSQASAIAEVTSTLSELRQTSSQALEQSQGLLQAAERSMEATSQGAEVVEASVQGMQAIRDRVQVIQEKILALSDHTQQIGNIISTVNEIAEQSKLLALNASIEAARAGEFGKSFSVVANEMRDLAEQSKQATRQVRQLLSDIREATGAAVVATEDGIAKVDDGQRLAARSGQIMGELGGVIAQSVDASRLIANASRQQGTGVSQVADAMVNIDGAVRSTAQGMEQVRVVVAELSKLAQGMAAQVADLEVPQAMAAR